MTLMKIKRLTAIVIFSLSTLALTHAQQRAKKGPPDFKVLASRSEPKATRAKKSASDEVERIFERYFEAQGSVGAMSKIRTRIMRAAVGNDRSSFLGRLDYYAKAPGKSLAVIQTPGGAQAIEGYDGDRAWIQLPFHAAMQADLGSTVILDYGSQFVRKKASEMYSSTIYKGVSKVAGREAHVVQAARKGHFPQTLYFDATNGLLVRADVKMPVGESKAVDVAVFIDSYSEVDGIKLPTVFRVVYPLTTLTYKVFEIKHNVYINDELFNQPESSTPKQ